MSHSWTAIFSASGKSHSHQIPHRILPDFHQNQKNKNHWKFLKLPPSNFSKISGLTWPQSTSRAVAPSNPFKKLPSGAQLDEPATLDGWWGIGLARMLGESTPTNWEILSTSINIYQPTTTQSFYFQQKYRFTMVLPNKSMQTNCGNQELTSKTLFFFGTIKTEAPFVPSFLLVILHIFNNHSSYGKWGCLTHGSGFMGNIAAGRAGFGWCAMDDQSMDSLGKSCHGFVWK